MSRVCLVGTGVPGFIPARVHNGPGLRTEHFARALVADGHELTVIYVDRAGDAVPDSAAFVPSVAAAEADFENGALDAVLTRFQPEALVGAGIQGTAFAARLKTGLPLWADVFGDPMAEAQAKAVLENADAPLPRFWSMLGPVLAEADRFSAVSRRQADALVGQLGLAGRLSRRTAGEEMVSVVPCAAEAEGGHDRAALRRGLRAGLGIADNDFVVLWSGSFNTWCDIETLFEGLDRAMDMEPRLRFVATGGEVVGHDEISYGRFRQRVAASPNRARYHLAGWVGSADLPSYYAAADLGVVAELDLYERRLGSENRVAQWLAHGLAAATTAKSEFGRCLVARELAYPWRAGEPGSLAACLVAAASDTEAVESTGDACRSWAAGNLDYRTTAVPIAGWCRRPVRAGDSSGDAALSLGLFSEPASVVHLLESYLAGLSLGQLSWRSLRWFWRRLRGRSAAN